MKTFEFTRWSQFREWIDSLHGNVFSMYWRGQKDSAWPVASSFERLILGMFGGKNPAASHNYPYDYRYQRDGKPLWSPGFYQSMRDRYLDAFKRSAGGLRGHAPADLKPEQWWALGRHYGLVTPLLDWTESPYIAAFFALSELYADCVTTNGRSFVGRTAAVYGLFHNNDVEGDGLRVLRCGVDELGRLHAQRGLFTWLDSEEYFELEGFLNAKGRNDLLVKVTIADYVLPDAMRDFTNHGIDHRLLFPDLTGAALHANLRWESF
jgi:hypothetical protein